MIYKKERHGFTLLEIILVIALIAIAAGIAFTNFDLLSRGITEKSFEAHFLSALKQARYIAQIKKQPAYLSFDKDTASFIIHINTEEEPVGKHETGMENNSFLSVKFSPIIPEEGIGYTYQLKSSKYPSDHITINELGVSAPMDVILESIEGKVEFKIDPFSSSYLHQPK